MNPTLILCINATEISAFAAVLSAYATFLLWSTAKEASRISLFNDRYNCYKALINSSQVLLRLSLTNTEEQDFKTELDKYKEALRMSHFLFARDKALLRLIDEALNACCGIKNFKCDIHINNEVNSNDLASFDSKVGYLYPYFPKNFEEMVKPYLEFPLHRTLWDKLKRKQSTRKNETPTAKKTT